MAVTVFYANQNMQDIGVLKGFKLDMTVSMETGDNDFEVRTSIGGIEMDEGYYIYVEGSEYGGIIDTKRINTKDKTLYYSGRTWRGMLESKIIQPPSGQDYYKASGDLNVVLDTLIDDFGLSDLFYADSTMTGVTVTDYQFYRYTDVYSGIIRLLSNLDYKLVIEFDTSELKCKIGAVPIVDYGENQEVTSDLYDFDIKRVGGTVNHLIGLGAGELKDREVVHKYADANGTISDTQTLFGKDEVTAIYDYSNAEDSAELEAKTIEQLQSLIGSDSIEITLNEIDADVGDKVTAYEENTEIEAIQYVQSKVVMIDDETIHVQHSGKTISISEHGETRYPTEYERLKEEVDVLDNRLNIAGIGSREYNDCDTTNMLLVSPKYIGATQRVHVTDATTLTNCPSIWTSVGGTVIAYRQVMAQWTTTVTHAIVLLYEIYPVHGRIWINNYNTSWGGWHAYGGLGYGTMATTADLNNFTYPGTFWVNNLSTKTNAPPDANSGFLEVFRPTPAGAINQVYRQYNSRNEWSRTFVNNAWGDWMYIGGYTLAVREFSSGSISMAANSSGSVEISYTAPDNYQYLTFLTVRPSGNVIECYMTGINSSTNKVTVWWHNNWGSTLSATLYARIMFIRIR